MVGVHRPVLTRLERERVRKAVRCHRRARPRSASPPWCSTNQSAPRSCSRLPRRPHSDRRSRSRRWSEHREWFRTAARGCRPWSRPQHPPRPHDALPLPGTHRCKSITRPAMGPSLRDRGLSSNSRTHPSTHTNRAVRFHCRLCSPNTRTCRRHPRTRAACRQEERRRRPAGMCRCGRRRAWALSPASLFECVSPSSRLLQAPYSWGALPRRARRSRLLAIRSRRTPRRSGRSSA